MNRTIDVYLGESQMRIGILYYDRNGSRESGSFEYSDEWVSGSGGFQIDPGLPLGPGRQFRKRPTSMDSIFHGAIADTEPDGWGKRVIFRDHEKRRQTTRRAWRSELDTPLGAIDYLLGVDDFSRMGALRFGDEKGRMCRTNEPGRRTAPPLLELPEVILASGRIERNVETQEDLEYLQGRGTSLGGLRPKCSVIDDDGSLAIGKFPSVQDERAVTKGEVLALRLAADAGINAAKARLVDSAGSPVAIIRRFDRVSGGRLMYASAATMLQAGRGESEVHTYQEIVDVIRRYGANPKRDIPELWRRIAFSILINNVDDHLHNHGFLHVDQGRWDLAPAFDVNPFPDRARELKTHIGDGTGANASLDALWSVLRYFDLDATKAREVLEQIVRAVARWREIGSTLRMSGAELEAFADAFENSEREVAKRLIARQA